MLSQFTINQERKIVPANPKIISTSFFVLIVKIFVTIYDEGNDERAKVIVPSDATLYFTTRGKSFSKWISIWGHKLVHLMKYPKFLRENSP